MPPSQEPLVPPEPKKETPSPAGPAPIDPKSLLLPKKEVPVGDRPDSAQRINAGALLAQEQAAALPKPEPVPVSPPPVKKVEDQSVSPLQTYKGDLEKIVQDQSVSVVSIAAAEAERRGKQAATPEQVEEAAEARKALGKSIAMYAGAFALVAIAAGVLAFIFLRPTSVPGPQSLVAPFISVDDVEPVVVDTPSREALMTKLVAARKSTKISLGLVRWLYLSPPTTDGSIAAPLSAQDLIGILAPQAPAEILRTLRPTYFLGIHSFDENQPFLILDVDSYGTAYAGMLDWERTLSSDLLPLFNRTPSPRPVVEVATSTATSTEPQFLSTEFVDKVVENRDVRALLGEQGDILLLWTFLGRNTIVIATNEYTLREVVSRMNQAPITPIPGR